MEFGLSEEQRLLQDSVGGYLEDKCPLDRVREVAESSKPVAQEIWDGLSELGANGAMVPEEFGGMGLGLLDAALIQEMIGRRVAPVPFTANVMATIGLMTTGTEDQKAEYLPEIATGQARFAVAVSERTGAREGAAISSEDGSLSGKAMFAIGAGSATHHLIADATGALNVVANDAKGLKVNPLPTIDATRTTGELILNNVNGERLTAENEPGLGANRAIAAGRVLLSADTLGASQMMIEKSVEYAKERKQFNRIIASFQAVKHLCAEMASELEPCRSLVWYAAHAFDAIPDEAELMACHAKAHLADTGQFVARTATEVHGGIGFTDLLGLHYWFKRIGLNRQLLGGPVQARADAARLQGWAA